MIATGLYIIAGIGGVSFVLGITASDTAATGIFASIALVSWAIVAFQAGNITVVTDSGTQVTTAAPALQWLGLALAGVSALGVIKGFTGAT